MTPEFSPESPDVRRYLGEAREYAGAAFRYERELGRIVAAGSDPSRKILLEEILFAAAFVTNARKILGRSGIDTEETARLSAEFAGELERLPSLLNRLVEGAENSAGHESWNPSNPVQMAEFLDLCGELAILHAFDRDRPQGRPGRRTA
jgi:hypothetical protein